MAKTVLPTLPSPTIAWTDSTGRPTQPFTQYETSLIQALQGINAAVSASASSSSSSSGSSGSSSNPKVTTKTANYSLLLSDQNNILEMDVASANTVTIPPNSATAFPVGAYIPAVVQKGAGQTQIVAGSGVTLRSRGSATKLTAQYSAATLYQRALNDWVLCGDISS